MFNSPILDIFIGLSLIFTLYSLLATTFQEILASLLGLRSKVLEFGIMRMLEDSPDKKDKFFQIIKFIFTGFNFNRKSDDNSLKNIFYKQPNIKYLANGAISKSPAYIHATDFSKAVINILSKGTDTLSQIEKIEKFLEVAGIEKPDGPNSINFKRIVDDTNNEVVKVGEETLTHLYSLYKDAGKDLTQFRTELETWFNRTMERVSGWYKKQTQWMIFVIGFIIAVSFNVDTIKIAENLSKNDEARKQMVTLATSYVNTNPVIVKPNSASDASKGTMSNDSNLNSFSQIIVKDSSLFKDAEKLIKGDIEKSNKLLAIGWEDGINGKCKSSCCCCCWWKCFFMSLLGWFITAIAISLGAPFWFDLLSKFVKLRGSVNNPDPKKANS